ncbi:MAG TPA: NAD(P)-dependent alcohol dehydrogenase [Propionibacteriaceae bacterium]|nr:NAD(P)-dependent alcohol dehydrogenase [Propionibacteriaceae bacterium]
MPNSSAVLYAAGDLRIEDRPEPQPGVDEVLVEVAAVGICGSDVHYYDHGRIGEYIVVEPMIVGHESAGVIVDVGSDVDRSRIGQLVAMEPGVPCRSCQQCLAGRYNLCPDVRFFATPPIDGSISRLVSIEAAFAHPAPEGLTAEQAAMAEPVSVGVWAARKTSIGPGDRVLVTGAGPVGLYAAQVARSFGAAHVTITDVSDFRLAKARELGLATSQADGPLTGEFDVLLECSGAQPALTAGIRAMAPAGRVALVGMGSDAVSIDVPVIQGRELTISGVFRYANTYPLALQLIASGAVNVTDVISHRFPLAETERALTIAKQDPRALKALVLPQT